MIQNQKKAIRTAVFSIIGNSVLAVIKFLTGFFGNSFALIADAIESTTDVFSSTLLLIGIRYSTKPADENHPYGHGKAEPLVTFAIVGFLLISAAVIVVESIRNIRTPHEVPENYTLVILAAIILVKEGFYRYVTKSSEETNSTSLKADAWHHRSDAITSLMAFIGISIAIIFGEGYETADDWAALLAAGIIAYNAFLIFRPALGEIMDEDTHDELVLQIRKSAIKVDGVLGTEKCMVRKMGMEYHVDLHLIVPGNISVEAGHRLAHQVKDAIQRDHPQIADILIHVEPGEGN